jgi:tRNA (cmo5U34)-methyltransferase
MTKEDRFKGQGKDYHLHNEIFPHKEELTRRLAQEVATNTLKNDGNFLDIGIGTGNTTRAVIYENPKIKILGIDPSADMLDKAHINLVNTSARFVCRDALSYLHDFISPNSVSGVFSAYTIHNFERGYREDFFKEVYKVLEPEAAFVNLDIIYPDDERKMHEMFRWQAQKMATYAEHGRLDLSQFWLNHICEDFDPSRRLTEGQYLDSLKQAGFRDIRKVLRYDEDVLYVARK